MMENKWSLRTDAMPRDYGVRWRPTELVDKFVQNYSPPGRQAASARGFDKLMTKAAIENSMKSMTYYAEPCNARGAERCRGLGRHLWSVGMQDLPASPQFQYV
jgi:hypothetical protein